MKLPRTKQCSKCPWKVSTDPTTIPNGYCQTKHANLEKTIAKGIEINNRVMACHHSTGEDGMYCVGWLHNQLGDGNNIGIRIKMMECDNIRDLKVVGKQHPTFQDTLPKKDLP